MATHDYIVDNQNGANFRSDLNNALAAIVSNNSSATAPTTTYAFMLWADTANDLLKQRNAADSAWINILTLSTGAPLGALAASLVSGTHTNFTSTGIDDNATSTAITIDASENVALAAALTVNELTTFNNYGAQAGKGRVRFGVSGAQFIEGFDTGNAGSGSYLKMGDGTTDRLTITNAGNVKVNTGNLVIGTSGKGIDFSADGNAAGMTSEVLDDYEEGTWTPGIAFGDASVGVTYHSQTTGYYTKVGRAVTVHCYVALTNKGTSTGSITITGLPFANKSGSGNNTTAAIWCNGMTGLDTPIAYIGPGNTKFTAHNLATGTVQSFTNSNVANTSDMMLSVTYITA